jgi:hypothetical protein
MKVFWLCSLFVTLVIPQQVLTSQYDNFRTSANLKEHTLTPENINSRQFGKIGTLKVDGAVYAQPLYLAGVEIPSRGKHNVVFIATEHDSVYAFDADNLPAAPLWHTSFLNNKQVARRGCQSIQIPGLHA